MNPRHIYGTRLHAKSITWQDGGTSPVCAGVVLLEVTKDSSRVIGKYSHVTDIPTSWVQGIERVPVYFTRTDQV